MTVIVRGSEVGEISFQHGIAGVMVHIPDHSLPSLSVLNNAWAFVRENDKELSLCSITEFEKHRLVAVASNVLAAEESLKYTSNCRVAVVFDCDDDDAVAVVLDGSGPKTVVNAVNSAVDSVRTRGKIETLTGPEDRFAFVADEVVQRVGRDNFLLDEAYHDIVDDAGPELYRMLGRDLPESELAIGRFAEVIAGLETFRRFRTLATYTDGKKATGKVFTSGDFGKEDVGEAFLNRAAEVLAEEFGSENEECFVALIVDSEVDSYSMVSFDNPGEADTDMLVHKATAISQWRKLSLQTKESYAYLMQSWEKTLKAREKADKNSSQ